MYKPLTFKIVVDPDPVFELETLGSVTNRAICAIPTRKIRRHSDTCIAPNEAVLSYPTYAYVWSMCLEHVFLKIEIYTISRK